MSITIKSIKGYYFLDVWIMANIVQQATLAFCKGYLNQHNDPCGRLYDQMTMAARSVTANIAEGCSRHQTSRETEMKLNDVARASLSELLGDFFSLSLQIGCEPWSKQSANYQKFNAIQLSRPQYSDDIEHDAWVHIQNERKKFALWTECAELSTRLNAMMLLINRNISMLQKMISSQLDRFKQEGGFTENLTRERVSTQREQAVAQGSPSCHVCGKPMIRRTAKRGTNAGRDFWSCSDYPNCQGTRNI